MELNENWLDQPLEVSLETLSKCNAACSFCPYPSLERQGHKMPDELIDRLVKEMAQFSFPFMFSPFKVNEPLLDKRTLPLLRRMNKEVPHARLRIFTNGSALKRKEHCRARGIADRPAPVGISERCGCCRVSGADGVAV